MPTAVITVMGITGWILNRVATTLDKHGDKLESIDMEAMKTVDAVQSLADKSELRFTITSDRAANVERKLDGLDTRLRNVEIKVRP